MESITILPIDMWNEILGWLSLDEFIRVSLTCKLFNRLLLTNWTKLLPACHDAQFLSKAVTASRKELVELNKIMFGRKVLNFMCIIRDNGRFFSRGFPNYYSILNYNCKRKLKYKDRKIHIEVSGVPTNFNGKIAISFKMQKRNIIELVHGVAQRSGYQRSGYNAIRNIRWDGSGFHGVRFDLDFHTKNYYNTYIHKVDKTDVFDIEAALDKCIEFAIKISALDC